MSPGSPRLRDHGTKFPLAAGPGWPPVRQEGAALNDEMYELSERWREVFGTAMPYGFEVTDDDAPTLHRCIEERSTRALDELVAERVGGGKRIH